MDKTDNALKCAEGMHPTQWFEMTVHVPFAHTFSGCNGGASDRMGTPHLRATSQGPLFSVEHSMHFGVTLSYGGADGTSATTFCLSYCLPLDFVRLRSAARTDTHSCNLPSQLPLERLSLSDPSALPPTNSYNVPELPAYSQLFHPNGDVKCDDGVPLPLYTPSPTPGPTDEGEHTPSDAERLLTCPSPLTENTLDHTIIGVAL